MGKTKQTKQDLLEVRGDLARLAWDLGARLVPCEFGQDCLIVAADTALAEALTLQGAQIRPFHGTHSPQATPSRRHARRHVQFHVARMHGDDGPEDDEAEAGPPAANA